MKEKTILIATSNAGKVREMETAFRGLPVRLVPLSHLDALKPELGTIEEPVEDGTTFMEALDGAPGVYSARYAGVHGDDAANNQKLIAELRARGEENACAAYHCALVLALEDGRELSTEGRCTGFIRPKARGTEGFGYDPYFYRADGRTMAELSREEKHAISHRGAALDQMKEKLRALLGGA